ncbi:MAG: GtrA family protein [Methylocystis sp.]|jgi:putative flippase GtrA
MRQARYLIVGGACALLNNILVIAFAYMGAGYAKASALAFGPVLAFGYASHTFFTFKTSASIESFARYALAMLANFPLWIGSLFVLCDLLSLPVQAAAPLTTALVFAVNYILAKWALRAGSAMRAK